MVIVLHQVQEQYNERPQLEIVERSLTLRSPIAFLHMCSVLSAGGTICRRRTLILHQLMHLKAGWRRNIVVRWASSKTASLQVLSAARSLIFL